MTFSNFEECVIFYPSLRLVGFKTPTLAAVSGLVTFRNWNEPLQAHLALTGDPTEIMYITICDDVIALFLCLSVWCG